ncbi:imidazole glycerol phosphate synthase subunit HisH [Falsibacillus albus]|uniref:Imidazole glycerol phosphate synthase subunit HisH n=1 Tax=Falsibacillus albus TaxID=2478915 RepID=A0A3L7JWB3_9BACI|nr:imidazole glycerol phosphate synthase subunit HisH [Falsibacillus albus]RLQ94810.1 imidazole glycerol phosphate synthase subunit HisH [Falsibacillus albus]
MIVIIDYNMGNVASVKNMIKKIGYEAIVSNDISIIKKATKLILPGVGSFDHGVKSLKELKLFDVIKEKILLESTPILGICLGMQLLTKGSEEGELGGLGLIDGFTKRFSKQILEKNLKIPHMGWNFIKSENETLLLSDMELNSRFYFVHSYHVVCENPMNSTAITHYGYDFTCMIEKENVYGVQFHPEKSHKFGMKIIKNFLELVKCTEVE